MMTRPYVLLLLAVGCASHPTHPNAAPKDAPAPNQSPCNKTTPPIEGITTDPAAAALQ
ncbi:MAG: hypothetical protein R3C68_02620 [Myxococcota bacterium]